MLNHIFQEACRSGGSRTALVFDNQRYSFAQLEEQVARCAASLKSAGAVPERGVALVLRTSPEFVYTFLAAARLGVPATWWMQAPSSASFAVCSPKTRLLPL